jgi:beta-N-acetylhexosaminidase
MTNAVLSRLPHDSALRADVNDSVHKVLTAKQNAGVLSCG